MAYRLEYDTSCRWEKRKEEWGIQRVILSCLFFVLFILVVNLYWKEGRDILIRLVFPQDTVAAWNGLQQLTDQIRQGVPLKTAAENFCNEVLQGYY